MISDLNPDEIILQTQYWTVELSYKQVYLGRCVVILNRQVDDLGKLSVEEQLDFFNVVQKLQNACKITFGATNFNWTCLMNDAYKSTPPKPWVHWHFRPRYKDQLVFDGIKFNDPNFGSHYDKNLEKEKPNVDFSPEFRKKIILEIQKYLD